MLSSEKLELDLGSSGYCLSARRLWEHTELGQRLPFDLSRVPPTPSGADSVIDIARKRGSAFDLLGCSLADILDKASPLASLHPQISEAEDVARFRRAVMQHLEQVRRRTAVRRPEERFVQPSSSEPFGVRGIWSGLLDRLGQMKGSRLSQAQWSHTIANLKRSGTSEEEIEQSGLLEQLDPTGPEKLNGADVARLADFSKLSLSVLPFRRPAERQLFFTAPPERKWRRPRDRRKAQLGETRSLLRFDPVLGYRIERVDHQSLWGSHQSWQVVRMDGTVLQTPHLHSQRDAEKAAAADATERFPKHVTANLWQRWAWTGGEEYREWLVTLPEWGASFIGSHFEVSNLLLHLRTDVREGPDGQRILLVQEVQSDWVNEVTWDRVGAIPPPPFRKEWHLLGLKLALLHAAETGMDGIAWTSGAHQVERFGGRGAEFLLRLYDVAIPRDVGRALRRFSGCVQDVSVYVPTNFGIRVSEGGYEVVDGEGTRINYAQSFEDARKLVPDGAHEVLQELRGVVLTPQLRARIVSDGFPAWGVAGPS